MRLLRVTRAEWPVRLEPATGCWIWNSKRDADGYGIANKPRFGRAHIVVYENEVGPVPSGLMLDHVCRRRDCVNPDHLEPVKQSINEQRKTWRSRVRIARCKNGHDLHLHAIVTPQGGRVCRLCKNARAIA